MSEDPTWEVWRKLVGCPIMSLLILGRCLTTWTGWGWARISCGLMDMKWSANIDFCLLMTGWLAPVGLRLLLHDTGAKEVDPELASHGGGWGVTGPSWLDSWSSLIADSSRGSCAVRAAAPWHPLSQPATAGVAEGREEVGVTHLHQGEGTDLAVRFYELWIFLKYPACVNLVTQ